MRRRGYLVSCSLVGVTLAGCTGGDTSEPTETEAAADQTAYEDAFRDALSREGIAIRDLTYEDGSVRLEYEPAEPTEAGVEQSIEVAARAYFDRVYGGWNAARLDASAYVDGSLVATWRMETAWIDAYLAGEITRDELGQRVEDSVERFDDESGDAGATEGPGGGSDAGADTDTDTDTGTDRHDRVEGHHDS